jgi:asparagine synthase (glutamine-hydrolysing)
VHALRGMYAFAIWDQRENELFLARDPFGIKPLYYTDNAETFRFASQVKALIHGGSVDMAPEPAGTVGFLVWGSVPEPYTLYRGIRSLPAGSYIRVSRAGRTSIAKFFDVGDELRKAQSAPTATITDAREILKDALADSVRHHMVSDVPVGLFLSAGIDSTTLAGLAAIDRNSTLNAVTLGFREFEGTSQNEVPIAAAVARQFGINHQAHWITRQHFESELPNLLEAMDQPSIDGVNVYFVSQVAAAVGMKVALSGLGGDELFGGYPSYRQVPALVRQLRVVRPFPSLGRLIRRAVSPFVGAVTSPKYAGVVEYGTTYGGAYLLRRALYMPWELDSMLDPACVRAGLETLGIVESLDAEVAGLRHPRSRVAALELSWYMRNQLLRDCDWAGMAHSLEIRVPFIDVPLFSALAPYLVSDNCPTKQDLAAVVPEPLSHVVTARPKTGFVTPLKEWAALATGGDSGERGLRRWAKHVLSNATPITRNGRQSIARHYRIPSGAVSRARLSRVAD